MNTKEEQFNRAKKSFSDRSVSDVEKKVALSEIYSSGKEVSVPSFFWRRKVFATFAIFLLLVSGGTTYAASQSLPGEPLYGIKVNVVEPIGMALSIGEEARANYQLSLIDKRIKELEALEREGRSNNRAERQSSNAMIKNLNNLEVIIDADGALDISSRVGLYNSLVSEEFIVESSLMIDTGAMINIPIDVEIDGRSLNNEQEEGGNEQDEEDTLTPGLFELPKIPNLDTGIEADILEEL